MFIHTDAPPKFLRADIEQKILLNLGGADYHAIYQNELASLKPRLDSLGQLLQSQAHGEALPSGPKVYFNYTLANRRLHTAIPVIFPHDHSIVKALDEDSDQPIKWVAFEPSSYHPYILAEKPLSYFFAVRDFPEEQRFATFIAIGLAPEVYQTLHQGIKEGKPAAQTAARNIEKLLGLSNHDWLHACMLSIRDEYASQKKCFSYPSALRTHYNSDHRLRDLPHFIPSQEALAHEGIKRKPVEAFSYQLSKEVWSEHFATHPHYKRQLLDLVQETFEAGSKTFPEPQERFYFMALTAAFAGLIIPLNDPEMQRAMAHGLRDSGIGMQKMLDAAYEFLPPARWIQTDAYAKACESSKLAHHTAAAGAAKFSAELGRSGIFKETSFLDEVQMHFHTNLATRPSGSRPIRFP